MSNNAIENKQVEGLLEALLREFSRSCDCVLSEYDGYEGIVFTNIIDSLFGNCPRDMRIAVNLFRGLDNSTLSGEFCTFVHDYYPNNTFNTFAKIIQFLSEIVYVPISP